MHVSLGLRSRSQMAYKIAPMETNNFLTPARDQLLGWSRTTHATRIGAAAAASVTWTDGGREHADVTASLGYDKDAFTSWQKSRKQKIRSQSELAFCFSVKIWMRPECALTTKSCRSITSTEGYLVIYFPDREMTLSVRYSDSQS